MGNNSIINWTVKLNENGFKMKAPHMTDTMPAGLYLDSSSLVVKEEVGAALTKDVDYEYSVAAMVDLSGQVYYRLSIDFKNDIEIPYIIIYKTYVMADAANTTYSNHIELDGFDSGIYQMNGNAKVQFFTGSAWGSFKQTNLGALAVTKLDGEDNTPLGYEIDDEDAETGSTLAGAKYSLSSPGQTTIYVTTGSDGTVTTNVALGIWEVTEINAPENYTLPDEHERTQAVEVTAEQDSYIVTFNDVSIKSELVIKTTDLNTGKLLKGAVYKIISENDPKWERTLTTDANGEIVISDIPVGKYKIVQITSPDGYDLSTTICKVTIEEDKRATVNLTNTVTIEPEKSEKPNAPIKPNSPDNSTVSNDHIKLEQVNTNNADNAGSPQTGDNTPIIWLFILLLVSVIAIISREKLIKQWQKNIKVV